MYEQRHTFLSNHQLVKRTRNKTKTHSSVVCLQSQSAGSPGGMGGGGCSGALEVLTNKRWHKHSRPLSKEKSRPSVESLKYWGEGVLPLGLPQGSGSSGRPVGHRDQLDGWNSLLGKKLLTRIWPENSGERNCYDGEPEGQAQMCLKVKAG